MDNAKVPKITKWPFFLGDAILLGFAAYAIYMGIRPLGLMAAAAAATIAGAWLCSYPYVLEYRALMRMAEAEALQSCTDKLRDLDRVGEQISGATEQWQLMRGEADKITQLSKSVAGQMAAEVQSFTDFIQKANETEKSHLRLEIDKLRRAEGEWLHVLVATLDHVFALYQAGLRSGQQGLVQQLGMFQNACRDVARRVGVVPFTPNPGDPYDPKVHHLEESVAPPAPDAKIDLALAPGYSYQGQFLRPALVRLNRPAPEAPAGIAESAGVEESAPDASAAPPPRDPQLS